MHVFGVIPGLIVYGSVIALVARTSGWRGAAFFFGSSVGFLFTESWILTASLLWVTSRLNAMRAAVPVRATQEVASGPQMPGGASTGSI